MRFGDWVRLLAENRMRVHPWRVPMAVLISLITPFSTVMSRAQRLVYGRRIDQTELPAPPLFIIGHWRSGTTYLHELLVQDPRFTYPTTYQCFAPLHFLLTEWFIARFCGFLLPKRRPMDNVQAGWQLPQEDEFALLTMGMRTPYRRMAFPNNGPVDLAFLDMREVDDRAARQWSQALRSFVQSITLNNPKRVVLKSPTHTGRVELLARQFPGAKFIHLTRHPFAIFPSTLRLWRSLDQVQACQVPQEADLPDYVFQCFERLYGSFAEQVADLPPNQFCDIRYEELVADPIRKLEAIYRQLELGDFDTIRPVLEEYVHQRRGYETNRYDLEPELRAEVRRRWSDYFERYRYRDDPSESEGLSETSIA
jgi:omega-hydroxy-beta-dihydromenaquinone-9 sulfotransferase